MEYVTSTALHVLNAVTSSGGSPRLYKMLKLQPLVVFITFVPMQSKA